MAEASLRYVIVHGEARFSRTECICGQNSRSEYRNGPFLVGGDPKRPETMQLEFGPRRALIHNRDLGYRFDIDLESRVYTAFELHEYRRPGVTSFTPKVESHEPSGRTVHVRTRRPCRSRFACGWAGGISNTKLGMGDEHVFATDSTVPRI